MRKKLAKGEITAEQQWRTKENAWVLISPSHCILNSKEFGIYGVTTQFDHWFRLFPNYWDAYAEMLRLKKEAEK